jgi:hypothetical protein
MAQGRVYADGKRLKVNEILARLTAKQRKFAEGLVYGGLSKAEAYRQAYSYKGSSEKGLRNNAVRAASATGVGLAVRALEEERTARWWRDKTKLQEYLVDGILKTAQETESDLVRLKAIELAGKTRFASLYQEPESNEANAALSGAMVDTLAARLQCLLGVSSPTIGDEEDQAQAIDTTFDPVPSDDTTPTETPTGGGEGE